ncbi:MAG: putative PEP-binding protein, partial [Phycisphaerales bacterium]|nr:putative PEP-binding protein [Phycisphaerales bacterium]
GGDPKSIEFCEKVGLDYVSCSPFRVPVARLAAAQAVIGTRAAPKRPPGGGKKQRPLSRVKSSKGKTPQAKASGGKPKRAGRKSKSKSRTSAITIVARASKTRATKRSRGRELVAV